MPAVRRGAEPHLRGGATGPAFCRQCHSTDAPSRHGLHWMGLTRAHVYADRPERGGGRLDAASRRCLGCHDGVTGSDTVIAAAGMPQRGFVGDRKRNHPVGVAYRPQARRRAEVPLKPTALLPVNVILPGGQVSCISCHDIYAPQRGLLTVPIEGSRLCLTCHELD